MIFTLVFFISLTYYQKFSIIQMFFPVRFRPDNRKCTIFLSLSLQASECIFDVQVKKEDLQRGLHFLAELGLTTSYPGDARIIKSLYHFKKKVDQLTGVNVFENLDENEFVTSKFHLPIYLSPPLSPVIFPSLLYLSPMILSPFKGKNTKKMLRTSSYTRNTMTNINRDTYYINCVFPSICAHLNNSSVSTSKHKLGISYGRLLSLFFIQVCVLFFSLTLK